jgi:DNA topoisomerase-1
MLDPDQAKLYELIWLRTVASQMESAELERTTADIAAKVGSRMIDLRATGTVIKFDGFLTLYHEDMDDPTDDDESNRLPEMSAGESLEKRRIDANQHFTEPPPRYSEASLVKRMEELGIGRPSTYASILQVLKDRGYVRIEKKRLIPEDKGRVLTAFLESFFARYVEYDFTAGLEEQLDRISNNEIAWRELLRDFWRDFTTAVGDIKELRIAQVIDALDEMLAPHLFPPRPDGTDPRKCPNCETGKLSLKLGRFGGFIGCTNYPECRYTRQFSAGSGNGDGGMRKLGLDPATGLDVTVRSGRFGPYIQLGEPIQDADGKAEKPKRAGLPKGVSPDDVDLERALGLLSLPREIDVEDVGHVINYDLPHAPEDYVHRIGRTARAAASGVASTFAIQKDSQLLARIEHVMRTKIPRVPVPREDPVFQAEWERLLASQQDPGPQQKDHGVPQRTPGQTPGRHARTHKLKRD